MLKTIVKKRQSSPTRITGQSHQLTWQHYSLKYSFFIWHKILYNPGWPSLMAYWKLIFDAILGTLHTSQASLPDKDIYAELGLRQLLTLRQATTTTRQCMKVVYMYYMYRGKKLDSPCTPSTRCRPLVADRGWRPRLAQPVWVSGWKKIPSTWSPSPTKI